MTRRTPQNHRQQQLPLASPRSGASQPNRACDVVPVGKRRDGGTRYWCLAHKADATAKYGRPAAKCRYADIPPILEEQTLKLDLARYPGGVACWGAVPPVYDTTLLPLDRGIHVHARTEPRGPKVIDGTFRRVVLSDGPTVTGIELAELDAIYYMVTSVFGYEMREIRCAFCGYSHLDKDWFSVNAHQRHLCAGCGKQFRDTTVSIGNPIVGVRAALGMARRHAVCPSRKRLNIRQKDFPGGLQIWGSNPALIWTAKASEEEGIHVHAFREHDDPEPEHDDTYVEVVIDGVHLDPTMVRLLMAQNTLPHIMGRVVCKNCPRCGLAQLATKEAAYTPTTENTCTSCHYHFPSRGPLRKTISNPLVVILDTLVKLAPRKSRQHDLGLIPETL